MVSRRRRGPNDLASGGGPARRGLEIDPSRWTWADYGTWSRHYAHCDNGESASTLDWFITHKLAREWRSLPQLAELFASAPALADFVLSHVGDDASMRDLVQLRRNAQRDCPQRFTELCRELVAAPLATIARHCKPSSSAPFSKRRRALPATTCEKHPRCSPR
jgi:hypothetical protein